MTLRIKADVLGMVSGSLCLVHCLITPFIFLAESYVVADCADKPIWWQLFDYLFIAVSFFSVYFSTKNSSEKWMKKALWISWCLFVFAIINESFET